MHRRSLLIGAASAGGIALLGCGGSGSGNAPDSNPPQPDIQPSVWDPSPWMWFIAGQSRTIDLTLTLPVDVNRGGNFGLASGSALMPSGFALSPAGLLTATNPAEGQTPNIVFTYTEPA